MSNHTATNSRRPARGKRFARSAFLAGGVALALLTFGAEPVRATTLYHCLAGSTWGTTANSWSTTQGGGCNQTWGSGDVAEFDTANDTITGSTIVCSGITANQNVTVTAGGTWQTSGTVVTITVATSMTFNFNGESISTAAGTGFIKAGGGTLAMGGANTYPGGFTLNTGYAIVSGVNSLGTGPLALNGGTLQTSSSSAVSLAGKPSSITIGGDFAFGGTGQLTFDQATALGGVVRTITVSDTAVAGVILNGIISGTAGNGLVKAGTGLLTLGAANTYNGFTTINVGTLALGAAGSFTSATNITLAGGATFDVSGLTTALTLGNGQTLTASGSATAGTINTASAKGLTMGATTPLVFSAYDGTHAPLTVTGAGSITLASGNPVTVTVNGSALAAGDYKLIAKGTGNTTAANGTAPSSITVNGTGGLTSGTTASLVIGSPTAGELYLHVATSCAPATAATAVASPSATVCSGTTLTLTETPSAGTAPFTYQWKNGGVAVSGTEYSGGTTATLTINPVSTTDSGAYTCDVTATCGGGTSTSSGLTVTVNASPNSTITTPGSVCSNSTGNTASVPTTSGATYSWTISGGTITAGTGTSQITFSAGTGASVVLNCTVTANGCSSGGSQNQTVTINSISYVITAPGSVCSNSTGNTASVPTPSGATYSWTISSGTITSGQTSNVVTFTGGASGNVVLNCTITASGCSAGGSQNTTVPISTIPGVPVSAAATNVTSSSFYANWGAASGATSYLLDVATDSGFTSFVPGYNNTNVSNVTTVPVTNLNPSTTYYYRVRASDLCGASASSTNVVVSTPQVLVGWDVSGLSNFGASPLTPASTLNSSLTLLAGLTRGSGVDTNATAAARAWGGVTWTNTSEAAAISSNQYAYFAVTVNPGSIVSFTSVSQFNYRRSATGPTNGELQYSLDGNNYTDVVALNYSSSSSSGATLSPIDLSGVGALQNTPGGTKVYFRIVNWGGTSSAGTWYIYDVDNSTANDIEISGAVATCPAPAAPTPSAAPSSSVCAGASITLTETATGGQVPLSYQWLKNNIAISGANSNTYTIASTTTNDSGNYSCVVTSSCGAFVTSASLAVTVNAHPNLSLGKTDVVCNGGSNGTVTATFSNGTGISGALQVNIDGGSYSTQTSPYTFTGLAPGSHTVALQDVNGCTSNLTITVSQPTAVTFTTSQVNETCNGQSIGSITVTASGGSGSYTYSDNNGSTYQAGNVFSGLAAGTYNIVVKDGNGCLSTSTPVTITQPSAVSLSIGETDVNCNGGSDGTVTATFSGGTGTLQVKIDAGAYSAQTSPYTFTGLSAGSHTVSAQDANGCTTSQSITVNQPAAPTVTASSNAPFFQGQYQIVQGQTLQLIASTVSGATAYNWSRDGGGTFATGQTVSDVPPAGTHTYTVTVPTSCGTAVGSTPSIVVLTADASGVPDSWKTAHGYSTSAPSSTVGANGFTLLQSYEAGLNPTNAASVLDMSLASVTPSGIMTVSWQSEQDGTTPTRLYDFYSLTAPYTNGGSWSRIDSNIAPAGATTSLSDDAAGMSQRFYRVTIAGHTDDVATIGIAGVQMLTLQPGANYISMSTTQATPTLLSVLGTNLPQGAFESTATTVDVWDQTSQAFLVNNARYWLGTGASGWIQHNTAAPSNNVQLDPTKGFIVTIPAGHGPQTLYVPGFVPTVVEAQTVQSNGYTVASSTYPQPITLTGSGLSNSVTGGISLNKSDNLLFFNPADQLFDIRVWYYTGDQNWHNADASIATQELQPGGALLIERRNRTTNLIWTNPVPYQVPLQGP